MFSRNFPAKKQLKTGWNPRIFGNTPVSLGTNLMGVSKPDHCVKNNDWKLRYGKDSAEEAAAEIVKGGVAKTAEETDAGSAASYDTMVEESGSGAAEAGVEAAAAVETEVGEEAAGKTKKQEWKWWKRKRQQQQKENGSGSGFHASRSRRRCRSRNGSSRSSRRRFRSRNGSSRSSRRSSRRNKRIRNSRRSSRRNRRRGGNGNDIRISSSRNVAADFPLLIYLC